MEGKKEKMNKKAKPKKYSKGVITAYLLVVVGVAATLLSGLVIFVSSSQRKSLNEVSRQQALGMAESGVYYYRWYLAHTLDGKSAREILDFWDSTEPIGIETPFEKDVLDFSGAIVGHYSLIVEPPEEGSTIVMLRSTGWDLKHPEIKKTIQVRFRRPSWSEFSVLANDVMRFGQGTTVYGPIHSNNGIRFDGVANNIVSSSVATYRDPDTGQWKDGVWTSLPNENQVFLAGKSFPVAGIDFNGVTVDLSTMRTEAQAGGVYLAEDYFNKTTCVFEKRRGRWGTYCDTITLPVLGYHLTLRTDDTVEVRRVTDYDDEGGHFDEPRYNIINEDGLTTLNFPNNGLIFSNKPVWVDGTIDSARLTIVSADLDTEVDTDIYINNDILYTNKDGRDTIGLIAENNISVGLYSEDDLEIDAALLAQKGRVGRLNYQNTGYKMRNVITLFGSMATNQRYGFAYVDTRTGLRSSGYDERNLYFDNNLIYFPPPYFPTGNVYGLDLWEEL